MFLLRSSVLARFTAGRQFGSHSHGAVLKRPQRHISMGAIVCLHCRDLYAATNGLHPLGLCSLNHGSALIHRDLTELKHPEYALAFLK